MGQMMSDYDQTIEYWDNVFNQAKLRRLDSEKSGYPLLDDALDWLSASSSTVLDFGSGSGAMLAYLAKRKDGHYHGIDVSPQAIDFSKRLFEMNHLTKGYFKVGSLASLSDYDSQSFDAIILSNVLDNIHLNDALTLIKETSRLLTPEGKLLIKLNPYYDNDAIANQDLKNLGDDFYLEPSGLFLLNKPDAFWLGVLEKDYTLHKQMKIFFTENQHNRMYLCIKKT